MKLLLSLRGAGSCCSNTPPPTPTPSGSGSTKPNGSIKISNNSTQPQNPSPSSSTSSGSGSTKQAKTTVTPPNNNNKNNNSGSSTQQQNSSPPLPQKDNKLTQKEEDDLAEAEKIYANVEKFCEVDDIAKDINEYLADNNQTPAEAFDEYKEKAEELYGKFEKLAEGTKVGAFVSAGIAKLAEFVPTPFKEGVNVISGVVKLLVGLGANKVYASQLATRLLGLQPTILNLVRNRTEDRKVLMKSLTVVLEECQDKVKIFSSHDGGKEKGFFASIKDKAQQLFASKDEFDELHKKLTAVMADLTNAITIKTLLDGVKNNPTKEDLKKAQDALKKEVEKMGNELKDEMKKHHDENLSKLDVHGGILQKLLNLQMDFNGLDSKECEWMRVSLSNKVDVQCRLRLKEESITSVDELLKFYKTVPKTLKDRLPLGMWVTIKSEVLRIRQEKTGFSLLRHAPEIFDAIEKKDSKLAVSLIQKASLTQLNDSYSFNNGKRIKKYFEMGVEENDLQQDDGEEEEEEEEEDGDEKTKGDESSKDVSEPTCGTKTGHKKCLKLYLESCNKSQNAASSPVRTPTTTPRASSAATAAAGGTGGGGEEKHQDPASPMFNSKEGAAAAFEGNQTLAHRAITNGLYETVLPALVERARSKKSSQLESLHAADGAGRPPLHSALHHPKYSAAAKFMLTDNKIASEFAKDLQVPTEGKLKQYPIHIAINHSSLDVVKLLADHYECDDEDEKLDLSAHNSQDLTPLAFAVHCHDSSSPAQSRLDLVDLLLLPKYRKKNDEDKKGVDLLNAGGGDGLLFVAMENKKGGFECLKHLLDNSNNQLSQQELESLLLQRKHSSGHNCLHYCAHKGNSEGHSPSSPPSSPHSPSHKPVDAETAQEYYLKSFQLLYDHPNTQSVVPQLIAQKDNNSTQLVPVQCALPKFLAFIDYCLTTDSKAEQGKKLMDAKTQDSAHHSLKYLAKKNKKIEEILAKHGLLD